MPALLLACLPAALTPGALADGRPAGSSRPTISALKFSPDRFRVRSLRGPHHTLSGGTHISFMLSRAGTVELFVSPTHGCDSRAGAHGARHCSGYGTISVTAHAGRTTIFFGGKLGWRLLPAGEYQLAEGARNSAPTARFTIL